MPATDPRFIPERRNQATRRTVIERVAGEFTEMRCLRLTAAQAQRLFGLRADICQRVLGGLVADGTLVRGSDGRYRLSEQPVHSPFALTH
jgi:hypothetical protein